MVLKKLPDHFKGISSIEKKSAWFDLISPPRETGQNVQNNKWAKNAWRKNSSYRFKSCGKRVWPPNPLTGITVTRHFSIDVIPFIEGCSWWRIIEFPILTILIFKVYFMFQIWIENMSADDCLIMEFTAETLLKREEYTVGWPLKSRGEGVTKRDS